MHNVSSDELRDWQADACYLGDCLRKITKQVLLMEQTITRMKIQLEDVSQPNLLRRDGGDEPPGSDMPRIAASGDS